MSLLSLMVTLLGRHQRIPDAEPDKVLSVEDHAEGAADATENAEEDTAEFVAAEYDAEDAAACSAEDAAGVIFIRIELEKATRNSVLGDCSRCSRLCRDLDLL